MNKKNALVAGSFDPPTLGHYHVIASAARAFDEVFVAVSVNADKTGTFSTKERVKMLEMMIDGSFDNVTVLTIEQEYTVKRAKELGCSFLVRGARTVGDFEYERTLSHVNSQIEHDVESVIFLSPKHLEDVSSSIVRGLIGPAGWRRIVNGMVHPTTMSMLEQKFAEKLWLKHGIDKAVDGQQFDALKNLYCEPRRGYHNLGHIIHCFEQFDCVKDLLKNPLEVATAIWYHDAIYDPRAVDNEAKSAALFKKDASANVATGIVVSLIEATSHHFDPTFNPQSEDVRFMLDIDLSSFACDDAEQERISAAIRKEYEWIPIETYRSKRAELLESLEKRQFIYRTSYFRDRFETKARANLKREIAALRRA